MDGKGELGLSLFICPCHVFFWPIEVDLGKINGRAQALSWLDKYLPLAWLALSSQ